jgi:predicted RND superfamily exporter protein
LYESIFMSIKYFYFLYTELKNNEANCLKYKEDSEILNDMNKLKEYISKQQLNLNSITSVTIQVEKLEIKPEYVKYIKLYGVPYKLIFDPNLLQEIIDEMKT